MNKIDVQEICQSIAAEYPGWQYLSHKFKYKGLSHSEIWIDPSWVLHLSAEPSVIIFNKSVRKIIIWILPKPFWSGLPACGGSTALLS